jgi:hypothetical protein
VGLDQCRPSVAVCNLTSQVESNSFLHLVASRLTERNCGIVLTVAGCIAPAHELSHVKAALSAREATLTRLYRVGFLMISIDASHCSWHPSLSSAAR